MPAQPPGGKTRASPPIALPNSRPPTPEAPSYKMQPGEPLELELEIWRDVSLWLMMRDADITQGVWFGVGVGIVRGFLRRVDWRRGRVKWWVGVGERAWPSRVVRMGDG